MQKKSKKDKVSIGGQAVLEGVMMRGKTAMATAVRDENGEILIETKRIKQSKSRKVISRIPIIRGVYSFIQSMFGGVSVLMRSAEVYGEGEPSKFEKWVAKTFKIDVMSAVGVVALLIAAALSVFLFIWLPQFIRVSLESLFSYNFDLLSKNLIEGGVKVLIFVLYIVLCSLLNDIKRTYMYHGAEHKTITCYEKGLDLTVDNAKKCSRIHDRCGTMFLILVVLISIVIFACFEGIVGKAIDGYVRVLCKILLLPLTAGFSYEVLKLLAKTDSWVFFPLKVPGILLQKITTREPDDKMLEVAITAFKTVMEMDNDQGIPTVNFVTSKKASDVLLNVYEQLSKNGITEQAEAEWIVSLTSGIPRDSLKTDRLIKQDVIDKINDIVKMRVTGRPLWYCIGDTSFYGYTIKVDERVLIPRPETELLVYEALNYVSPASRVLDLCTGSGAIAIAINKKSNANVTAVDISDDALAVAKQNANLNGADVVFIKSDLLNQLKEDEKFNVIISNPPYVSSCDIENLQGEVKNFEPRLALDGGADGLDFYRRIAVESKKYLSENGVLLLEVGISQAEAVKNLLTDFSEVKIIKDYENIDRIVVAVV